MFRVPVHARSEILQTLSLLRDSSEMGVPDKEHPSANAGGGVRAGSAEVNA